MATLRELIDQYHAAQQVRALTPGSDGAATSDLKSEAELVRSAAPADPGLSFGALLQQHRLAVPARTRGNRFGRSKPGLSLNALARAAGIDPAYVLRLERGLNQNPSHQVVADLARALHLNARSTANLFRAAGYRAPVARGAG